MPLSLNEIKDRALAFSREWEGERAECAEAQSYTRKQFRLQNTISPKQIVYNSPNPKHMIRIL